jgi:hypothetical protein
MHISNEPATPAICEGLPVWTDEHSPRTGVLGLFVANRKTKALFGVTAAHLITGRGWFYTVGKSVLVGVGESVSRIGQSDEPEGYRPIVEAIALVSIDAATKVRTDYATASARTVGRAIRSFGATVSRMRLDGSMAEGELTGIECPLTLHSGRTGTTIQFLGALEVTQIPGTMAFAGNGDSGSLVYGRDGKLLGIVIGGTPQTCFVAPLEKLFEGRELELASSEELAAHNDLVRRPVDSDRGLVGYRAPLPTAMTWSEVDAFAHDIQNEPDRYERDKNAA